MENTNGKELLIVRYGEVALKGLNKPYFERMLIERIKRNLKEFDGITVKRHEGLIFVRGQGILNEEVIIRKISKVFGVASISPAVEVDSDMEIIGEEAVSYMQKILEKRNISTFKVEARRADKTFPVKSPEIGRTIGAKILIGCKVLKVDVHKPDCHLFINVRRDKTYIYEEKISAYGGLPLGTNGKGLLLLSGGIDSPVAGWMMAKRGMLLEAMHFHSYPYTSERALEKVKDLGKLLCSYCGRIHMHSVNLLPIQEQIVEHCPEEETTLLVRRFMMRIAQEIAIKSECMMLITGENLGQVASQTAEALVVTDHSVQMPVMRPLIAMDKVEIMDLARNIGTYETSILPYEDCCTVFLPKHPVTKPKLPKILESESKLDVEKLVKEAVDSAELFTLYP